MFYIIIGSTVMKNKIRDGENTISRIYHRDKTTNEIWFFDVEWPNINFNQINVYLKLNNKSFMYCTWIECDEKKHQKK